MKYKVTIINYQQFGIIYKIAYNAISNKKRPDYLCRSKVVSGATSVCGLQRSSLPKGKEATQSQNHNPEKDKPCLIFCCDFIST